MPKFAPTNPFRQRIVFFEGLDKSGKSTLCRQARFNSGHEVLMFDRGFVGRRVFRQFRKEHEFPIWDWNSLEAKMLANDMYGVIFCDVSVDTSMQRIVLSGEQPEFTREELLTQQEIYYKEIERLRHLGVPLLSLNTEQKTVEEAVRHVVRWIKGGDEWI